MTQTGRDHRRVRLCFARCGVGLRAGIRLAFGDRAVAVSMIERDLLMLESQADDYLEDTGLTV